MKCFSLLLLTPFIFLLFSQHAFANSGLRIMERVDLQSKRYQTQNLEAFMQIYDKAGSQKKRQFHIIKKRYPREIKTLMKFFKPASIKSTALLTKAPNQSEDILQWIYLPALRNISQLNTSKRQRSFVGSDFSYSDIAGRQLHQDVHHLVEETDRFFIIHSIPKNPKDTYSKIESVIDKSIWIPIRVVFFDQQRQKLKILNNSNIKKFGGLYLIMNAEMFNYQRGSRTMIQIRDVSIDVPVNDRVLGIKGLKD